MLVETIIQEIKQLPLDKRFFVIEKTLESIKNEEVILKNTNVFDGEIDKTKHQNISSCMVSEQSLAKDWLSEEDSRWDSVLK